jgi:hypothetical protein
MGLSKNIRLEYNQKNFLKFHSSVYEKIVFYNSIVSTMTSEIV